MRAISIALVTLVTCAGLAHAQPTAPLSGVKYTDLDLTTDEGAATLVDRVQRAAFLACKYPIGTPVQRRCVAETVAKSIAAINTPAVTKQYLARR